MRNIIFLILGGIMCLSSACQQDRRETTLRISLSSDPSSLDPRKGGDASKAIVEFMLFEGLTRFSKEGSIEPAGAARIDVSDDLKTYTFTLKNTQWSDGSAVSAGEYEKAWKTCLEPSFPCSFAHLFYPIKNAERAKRGEVSSEEIGVRAIDDRTLVVELEHPTPYFLELTAFYTYFPVKQKDEHTFLSNGPYQLVAWRPNSEMRLEKNPHYWAADHVHIADIHISIIDNEMTNLQLFEKGELDLAGSPLAPLPLESLPVLYNKGLLHTQPVAGSTLCVFNTQTVPFSNRHIRQAFAKAINRKTIVESITQMGEDIATDIVPPVLKHGNLSLNHDNLSAQEHLKLGLEELNLDVLPDLTYLYPVGELNDKLAQALQQQWMQTLGIHVDIKKMDKKTLLYQLDSKNFQMGHGSWLAFYTDQMNILERFKFQHNPKNFSGWESITYTDLLERANTEPSEQRAITLSAAETLLVEEVPLTVLYHWKYGYLQNPKLKDIFISPIGDIYFTHAYFEQQKKQDKL